MEAGATSLQTIERFVDQTRTAVFVRPEDRLLLIRPDKTMQLNESAVAILGALYRRPRPPLAQLLERLSSELGVGRARLQRDTVALIEALDAILASDYAPRPALRFAPFGRQAIAYPTIAEIALTYGCNAACRFCYAAAGPQRARAVKAMTTAQVELVIDKIARQAHVPSLSFTGGEATLRADLPRLIGHAKRRGLRVNLITNGLRAAEPRYAGLLAGAGLDSAQISLEAPDAALHDRIVGRSGAWQRTVAAVHNFRALGLHVHTNTTLCAENLDAAADLIRFVARELQQPVLSANMVIRTGDALRPGAAMEVSYSEIARRLPPMLELARAEGIELVWYSPIPYCIFNPALHGLGAKACACVDGLLSVAADGQVLPCSSFERGIGSLLRRSFAQIFNGRRARYWRKKRFVPPSCTRCTDVDLCGGGCPLYWDAAGSFDEIPGSAPTDHRTRRRWQRRRRRGGSFGVRPVAEPRVGA